MTDNNMQKFHSITLADREWVNEKLKESDNASCEYSFANNFIYKKVYDVQVGMLFGCGVIRYRDRKGRGKYHYSFPFGNGDKKAAVEKMKEMSANEGYGLCMYPVLENDRKNLIEWFKGEFEIDADRGDFDYVYTVEKLANLKGKKLHGKRNHIARFMDDNDWRYEPMSAANIEDCRKMSKEWELMRLDKWNDSMEQEINVLDDALDNFDALGFAGGVLYKADEIVAFTIGERLNSDTLVVHFEKAYPDLQGAYPMINQQFILHEGTGYTYVNREEDMGDMGLRQAKLSYHPDMILKKYSVAQSSVVFANETDKAAIEEIWRECFGDGAEYIGMYLENRFETENMFVIFEDGRPVSMLSLLPVHVTINGEKHAARYVYAVATLPAYRKKGYASKLIEHAFFKYNEPLILQPSSDGLRKYYEKLGFDDAFKQSPCWFYNTHGQKLPCIQKAEAFKAEAFKAEVLGTGVLETKDFEPAVLKKLSYEMSDDMTYSAEIAAAENMHLGKWQLEDVSAKEYKELRDSFFGGEGYVEWDEDAVKYAIKENAFYGGKAYKLTDNESGARKTLMYRACNAPSAIGRLQIIETTLDENELKEILPELLSRTGTSSAYEKNDGGMILRTEDTKEWECSEGYLNLTLG